MDWVVGQWVAINGKPAKICGIRETMIDYTYEPGSGRIYHLGVYDAAVGPFAWQVGKTYRTTLNDLTAAIERVSGGVVQADVQGWQRRFCEKTGVDIKVDGTPSGADAHLLPYLADEPSEPAATEPTLTERFTVEPDGDRWRVRDNQTGFVASGFLSAELAENALEGMKGGDMEWIWSLADKSFATAHLRLSRYHRTIKGVTIDLYDIAAAYGVKGHAEFHALKKIIMAGNRGYKSREQDLAEAEQSIQRARELAKGGE